MNTIEEIKNIAKYEISNHILYLYFAPNKFFNLSTQTWTKIQEIRKKKDNLFIIKFT